MVRAVCSFPPLGEAAPFHAGWAEGPCVSSLRFHEAVLRVIVSPSWGPSSLSSRAKQLQAVLARPKS
jgi:hypothetical protein